MAYFGVAAATSIALALISQPSNAQDVSLFSSSQSLAGGYVWGQAIGVTSIVFGSKPPTGKIVGQIVIFTGLLKITKYPVHSLANGKRQIAIEFDSKHSDGTLSVRSAHTALGFVTVAVDPDEVEKSVGVLTEIPIKDHPTNLQGGAKPQLLSLDHDHESAEGEAKLYLVIRPGQDWRGPRFNALRNKDPILLVGHIHHIPPVTDPIKLKPNMTPSDLRDVVSAMPNADKWLGASKKPIALLDELGKPQAWFTANVHVTTLTGVCGDGKDNDLDGKIDEELPNNIDDDGDGYIDEDATCPA